MRSDARASRGSSSPRGATAGRARRRGLRAGERGGGAARGDVRVRGGLCSFGLCAATRGASCLTIVRRAAGAVGRRVERGRVSGETEAGDKGRAPARGSVRVNVRSLMAGAPGTTSCTPPGAGACSFSLRHPTPTPALFPAVFLRYVLCCPYRCVGSFSRGHPSPNTSLSPISLCNCSRLLWSLHSPLTENLGIRFLSRRSFQAPATPLAPSLLFCHPGPYRHVVFTFQPNPSATMNARPHKQSMSELKLRRLEEHNQRLREDLNRPRIKVSEASVR